MAEQELRISLEQGRRWTFACAVDVPGWARRGRGDEAAIEELLAYRGRMAAVADRAGLELPASEHVVVVATVPGTATTEFGAPDVPLPDDDRPPADGEPQRWAAWLRAAWEELDAVVAASAPDLTKGPRGGGRDRDGVRRHVLGAERSYARQIGIKASEAELAAPGGLADYRERVLRALASGRPAAEVASRATRSWPMRYWVRRAAWHVLDHAWEIEDKQP